MKLEMLQIALALLLAALGALLSGAPDTVDILRSYLGTNLVPSVSDRDRFSTDGWRGPTGHHTPSGAE